MKPRVFVVQPIPEVALALLREVADVTFFPRLDRQLSADELIAAVKRADYLFAMGDTVITADVIDANPALKGISVVSKTGGNVDLAAARARKLPVAGNHPADPIYRNICRVTADLTMAMILALGYRLLDADRYTRCGKFQEQTMALMGVGCPGKTVGLIGLGIVGKFMVPRCRAHEMAVIYTKRTRLSPDREGELGVTWAADKEAVLRQSDYVVVACDYNPSTHLLIGAREFALMKPTAFFVNTGRGRIVDEAALVQALEDGTIAGAGLDVYWNEPPVSPDPAPLPDLLKLDNVILAPHNGGATWDVRGEMTTSVARNIVAMIKGQRAPGLLNPEIYGETPHH
jgi:glyoxylate reductase